ncbi:hypothetical protein CBM2637_A200163 [Cupriavidus taiwanensis]|nr:hypothetical protein CBM2637_A200163 [Cupriavidus taiwanensis]
MRMQREALLCVRSRSVPTYDHIRQVIHPPNSRQAAKCVITSNNPKNLALKGEALFPLHYLPHQRYT